MAKKTLISRFKELEKESIGAVITLSKAISNTKTSKGEILRAFNKLVPKNEYEKTEKREILEDLYYKITKTK